MQNIQDAGTEIQKYVLSSNVEFLYRQNTKNGYTIGLDVFYDSSLKGISEGYNPLFYAIHLGYDFFFWRFDLRMQAGTYLNKKGHTQKGSFFVRPAVRLEVTDDFFIQLGLKTIDRTEADWIELGIGVCFNK